MRGYPVAKVRALAAYVDEVPVAVEAVAGPDADPARAIIVGFAIFFAGCPVLEGHEKRNRDYYDNYQSQKYKQDFSLHACSSNLPQRR
jgi:hypothetical protein